MLFLILFAVLAVGFVEAEMINAQISRNERTQHQAMTSAESGLCFIRHHMSDLSLPASTNSSNLLPNVAARLGTTLNGSVNMNGGTVTASGGAIYIPSQTGWVTHDPDTKCRFRITITQLGNVLVVKSQGSVGDGGMLRGVQINYVTPRSYSLVGINSLTLSGSAFTDSYDASVGAYSLATAKAGGSIGSNGNITLNDTARVNGDVRYGSAGTATIAPTAVVTGVTAPLSSPVSYPSVTLPPAGTYYDLGNINRSSGTITVPGGTYLIRNLTLSGTAKIVWNGPVKLYIRDSYNVSGNVVINTYQNLPVNRQLFFLPTCTNATWGGTNVCVGDLYAPDTNFTISGNVEKMGRVIAKNITNSSTKGMHYDESLPSPNGSVVYTADPASYLEVN